MRATWIILGLWAAAILGALLFVPDALRAILPDDETPDDDRRGQ